MRTHLRGAVPLPFVEHGLLNITEAEAALARLVEHKVAVRVSRRPVSTAKETR